MTPFRRFMVRWFIGLDGFAIKLFGKRYVISGMKAGWKFWLMLTLGIGVPVVIDQIHPFKYMWMIYVAVGLFVALVELISRYGMKHPLTMDEANWIEKQGYK